MVKRIHGLQAGGRTASARIASPVCLALLALSVAGGLQGAGPAADTGAAAADPAATIARAINDFNNGSLGEQTGALMLLGKYADPAAEATLLRALRSGEVVLRRAALVSLLESGQMLLAPAPARALLAMIDDPDVEIRRQVSAALPFIAGSLQMAQPQLVRSPATDPVMTSANTPKLVAALADPDPGVRRNMLNWVVGRPGDRAFDAAIAAAVADSDPQVAILALRVAGTRPSGADFCAAVAAVGAELRGDILWQRQLARVLHRHPCDWARAWLLDMLAAADPTLRADAAIALLLSDPPAWRDTAALDILLRADLSAEAARLAPGILHSARLGTAAGELAAALTAARSETLRGAAWHLWLERGQPQAGDPLLLRLLDEPAPALRERMLQLLANRPELLDEAWLAALTEHADPAVRAGAFTLLRAIAPELRQPVLLRLLIDDQTSIRQRALQAVVALRGPGWARLLAIACGDPDPELRALALDLARHTPVPELQAELRARGSELP